MGPRRKARTIGGCLCLLAALLLLSPGVRAVRAADGDTATVAPGAAPSARALNHGAPEAPPFH
jgi:hypothetical protein